MTGMETAQRNGTMPEAVRATAMMKTEILQKNRSSVMLSMRTTKPCVTATAETEACSGKKMPKETVQGITEYRYNGLHYVSNIKDPEGNVKREEGSVQEKGFTWER